MKAIIFPGQGAQKLGMGKDFYDSFLSAKEVYEVCSKASGLDVADLCFDKPDELNETEYTQIALVTTELAIMAVLKELGLKCDVTAGLSLGEYSALVTAGALELSDAASLIRKRGLFMQQATPSGFGAMSAVLGMDATKIEEVMKDVKDAYIANYNSDAQTVITGSKEGVAVATEKLKEAGAKRLVPLTVSGPFHSPYMDVAGEKLSEALKDVNIKNLSIPYVANATGLYVTDASEIKPLLVTQVSSSVRWVQSVKKMVSWGVDTFIEVGPGKTLTKLINKISPESRTLNVETVEDLASIKELLKEEE